MKERPEIIVYRCNHKRKIKALSKKLIDKKLGLIHHEDNIGVSLWEIQVSLNIYSKIDVRSFP